jgi:hypothetical protein
VGLRELIRKVLIEFITNIEIYGSGGLSKLSRPYVIWTPGYNARSGGIMVLHNFCHELNLVGQEAYIYTMDNPARNSELNTPYMPEGLENPIVVYPEIAWTNYLNINTVVRWLLNNPGKISGPSSFPPNEILYAFSHMFNAFNLPEERILFLPIIDTNIYKDLRLERDKVLFYIGKGTRSSFIDETNNAIEITRETGFEPQNLVSLLNTAKVLYCYDNITAITELARLCGCPVVMIPNGDFSEEKYREHEMGMEGLGWGKMPESFDSLEFMDKYKNLKRTFYSKLERFIEVTQKG